MRLNRTLAFFHNMILKNTPIGCIIISVIEMNVHEMRTSMGITQSEFATRYHIPFRTLQNWETGVRQPPAYMVSLLENRIRTDLINRRTASLPKYDCRKKNLPKRSDYIGAIPWLQSVQSCIGEDIIFALDEALMCQGSFGGRSDEFLIWVYGNDTVSNFNGVVVLGNKISSYNVQKKNGLLYTDFNRTLADAMANESILDMQGITEAVSKYYYRHGNTFDGIFVPPEYQDRFDLLAEEAINYYEY